ncbi:GATA type zinc finger transcription factor family protein [Perilla frutescens var. hirtella]|nr:GATA type zinc finger transcription factor family protein [Perilla frutescens var. frutescens]KAH6787379.1 GATA type zinc finger transcription factor family protein [Perilla frutescens var. hirtella]
MASFGTTQKCKACDKTVHFAEMMSVDGIPYHKACFKCNHCSGRLSMSTYSAVEGQLFCRSHYEQLCRENGSSNKSPAAKQGEQKTPPSKVSSFFSGTQEKCAACKKTVYPLEKITVEGDFYHKQCFKCAHGGCLITPSSYAALDGTVYCKPHFAQLFKEKGSYSNISKKKNAGDTTPTDSETEPDPKPEPEPEPAEELTN